MNDRALQRDRSLWRRGGAATLLASLTACASARVTTGPVAIPSLPSAAADTIRSERIAPGVVLHHLVRTAGPLRADVLDLDLTSCVRIRAVKGAATAVGRTTTSALLQSIPASEVPIAAVNADFFIFAPPGVPVGPLIESGRVLTGPIDRPVLAMTADGTPYVGPLASSTLITGTHSSVRVPTWNRPRKNMAGVVDAAWGQPLDSLTRPGARMLIPLDGPAQRYRVAPLAGDRSGMASADTLLLFGAATATIPDGDTVSVRTEWSPVSPRDAVGGFPMLLRDSAVVTTIDTDGAAGFRGLNPRTAAGIASHGRRLFLVVIDGRQASYSIGTTTRETAELLRAIGAVDAVNLDGGGSSALVVRSAGDAAPRVVNRPSDAAGERPVGDALAVLGTCRSSAP